MWWNATAGPTMQWILFWIAMAYYAKLTIEWIWENYFDTAWKDNNGDSS